MNFVAECRQCGVVGQGSREEASDAADDHEDFHDVKIRRATTDAGVDGGVSP